MDNHERAARRRRRRLPDAGARAPLTRAATARLLAAVDELRWRDAFVAAFTRSRRRAAGGQN
jgi:hypothetical protein